MALIDPTQLRALRDLAVGDDEFVTGIIDAFLPQLRAIPGDLRRAVDDDDAEAVVELAHSLKGSASNLGAEDVAGLCRSIEQLARNGELDGLPTLLTELEVTAAATLRAYEIEKTRPGQSSSQSQK